VYSQTGPAGEEAGGEGYVPVTDNESGFWQTVSSAATSCESAVQEEACLLSDTRVSDGPEEAGSPTGARETPVRDEAGRETGVRKEGVRDPTLCVEGRREANCLETSFRGWSAPEPDASLDEAGGEMRCPHRSLQLDLRLQGKTESGGRLTVSMVASAERAGAISISCRTNAEE
jgi:hypothetical protein